MDHLKFFENFLNPHNQSLYYQQLRILNLGFAKQDLDPKTKELTKIRPKGLKKETTAGKGDGNFLEEVRSSK